MYKKIDDILNNNSNNYQKQLKIENNLKDFWRKEILLLFKNKKNLFSSSYGLNILISNILKLDRDLNDFKFIDKRYLKSKNYKNLLLFSNNWDIISIVLSSVIPYCIKYDSVNNFNVVTLVGKIGKEISNNFYKNEWLKY